LRTPREAGEAMTVKQEVIPDSPPTPRNVYQRWNAVLRECGSIEKSGENKDQKYNYMPAADLLKMLRPLIAKHGLVLKAEPNLETITDAEYDTRSGGKMYGVRLSCTYTLINIDDPSDLVEFHGVADADDTGDKALHKARTGAMKYTLRDNFLIDAQDTVDSDEQESDRSGGRVERTGATQGPLLKQFHGRVLEFKKGQSDSGEFVKFNVHNEESTFISFLTASFDVVKEGAMLSGTAETKRDSKNVIWFKVVKVEADAEPLRPQTVAPESDGRSMKQILDGLFPTSKEIKYKRLIETAIQKEPSELHMLIVKSFEGRVKRETPNGELGLLSALDIAIQEAKEEFAVNQAEGENDHDNPSDYEA